MRTYFERGPGAGVFDEASVPCANLLTAMVAKHDHDACD